MDIKVGRTVFVLLIFSLSIGSHSSGNSTTFDEEIRKGYIDSDYTKAANLLEQQIKELKEKEPISPSDLYRKSLLLAHIYAWKLNKPDSALEEYLRSSELRKTMERSKESPPIELLWLSELYEKKGDNSKAREYLQELLKELISSKEKAEDDLSIIIADELINLVKYQIDCINLKEHGGKGFKPLLDRIKPTSSPTQSLFPLLTVLLVPSAEFEYSIAMKTDPSEFIANSPQSLSYMMLNYGLILNLAAGSVSRSSEQAVKAYLSKYSDSYFSLLLRFSFYRFYKDSGQDEKAGPLLKGLKETAVKRGMKLILSPDERFLSPEKTWKTYIKALTEGDVETVTECYIPGQHKERQIFNALGKEKMKKIGQEMGTIQKVTGSENEAKYRIRRMEDEKEITYYVHFRNIDGEWKMKEF